MTYSLTLTDEQLGVIDRALQEMPLRLAYPVLTAINRQLLEQQEAKSDDRAADPA